MEPDEHVIQIALADNRGLYILTNKGRIFFVSWVEQKWVEVRLPEKKIQ